MQNRFFSFEFGFMTPLRQDGGDMTECPTDNHPLIWCESSLGWLSRMMLKSSSQVGMIDFGGVEGWVEGPVAQTIEHTCTKCPLLLSLSLDIVYQAKREELWPVLREQVVVFVNKPYPRFVRRPSPPLSFLFSCGKVDNLKSHGLVYSL
jgi:hypothetical protein